MKKKDYFLEYYELAKKYDIPFTQVKAHAMHFTKGERGGSRTRQGITRTNTVEELLDFFQ